MAAEFVATTAANAVGNIATEYASPYVSYFFCYGKIVEEFKNKRKDLELENSMLKRRVAEAISQTEIIEQHVEEWLKEAEKQLEDAQGLEAEIERQKCFNWCPTWGWRYCLSKKVAKKTSDINKFLQRRNFQRVGYRAPLKGIEFLPSKDFKSSKSSNSAFDGIIRALNTNGVNMIGLYGMPGVGKTTLAKEVGKQAAKHKLFDKYVMVTMSKNPNISYIRDRIAELLDLKFEALTEEGKTEELWRGLKIVKKILIIIDDVWDEFSLQTIGIPFDDKHKGCKILLTTRRQQVCLRMNCQEAFQHHVLSEDEAWALFKDNAGLRDATSTLNDVAKEVASECKGLPLAIVTIGKALKGAGLNGWKAANQRFKDSRLLDNEDVCEGLYARLKLSYDYLKGDNIRSCFLLCSLFPEDSYIGIERLIMYGIGYGLFSNVDSMDVLRVEICEAIKKLQESSLLLQTDASDDEEEDKNEIYVRMHDVVRDLAHWITLREKNTFMVKEGLIEWPISESFECCISISFWESHINNFPDKLEFPKLKILIFEGKNSVKIPSVFFEGMKALQILHLKNVSFSLEVFKIVKNLRTLCFEDCEFENISLLRYLKNLEVFALLDTNIYELPGELVELLRLKSLHFSYFGRQECNFPPNLLSRLTSLQELHVTCPNNINLWELNSLSRLTALSLEVSTDHQCFQENFVFPKLSRYWIAVGGYSALSFMGELKSKTLEIGNFSYSFFLVTKNFSYSLSAFKELFCNVEKLTLIKVMELKNIVPSLDQKGLNELTSLRLLCCDAIEYLMDTTRENGPTSPPPISFLQNLKDVRIDRCKRLEVLFQMDGSLEKKAIVEHKVFNDCEIQWLWITAAHKGQCDRPTDLYEVAPLSNLTHLNLRELPELKWILKGPNHYFSLKSLKVVVIFKCHRLKYLFSPPLAQSLVLLEKLEIGYCKELEHIITKSENDDNTESESGHLHPPLFPKLTSLEIRECERLEYVCQIPLAQGLPHLQSLDITDAPQLKHVFNVAKEKNAVNHAIALPRLQLLRLGNLINLSCFCSENYPIVSPSLERLLAWSCPQLEFFNIQQEVNKEIQLKELYLEGFGNECYASWEKIFQIQTEEIALKYTHPLQGSIQFPSLKYLRNLKVSGFNRLKFLFSSMLARNLTQLYSLKIKYCEKLEEIIEMDQTSIASSSHAHIQPIFFPSLEVIRIKGCSKLKSLFPISVTHSLSKLKEIHIHGPSKLEQVFGYQVEINAKDDQTEMVFPALLLLRLSELPSLNSFAPTGYHFLFPSLYSFEATKCHKLTTSLSMDSKHHMHAITEETPQVAKDFNTVEEIVDNQSTSNDIIWRRSAMEGQMPLYMNVGETRIMLRKEVKK